MTPEGPITRRSTAAATDNIVRSLATWPTGNTGGGTIANSPNAKAGGAGCRLRQLSPVAFLPRNHALAIAIMSYDGELSFGLLGDYDALPDIDRIAAGLRDSIDELSEITRDRARNGASHNGHGAPRPVPTAT